MFGVHWVHPLVHRIGRTCTVAFRVLPDASGNGVSPPRELNGTHSSAPSERGVTLPDASKAGDPRHLSAVGALRLAHCGRGSGRLGRFHGNAAQPVMNRRAGVKTGVCAGLVLL